MKAAIAVAAVALMAWLLVVVSPIRAMGNDTFAGSVGGVVHHCGGGYDLRNVDWIADAAAHGHLPYFARPDADGHLVAPTGPLPNLLGSFAMVGLGDGDVVGKDDLRHRARWIASVLLAACAALLAWAARPREQPWRAAAVGLVATLSFAGCATLGQALWQQTIALVPLVAGFALVARRPDVPRLALAAPALLLAAAMIRPTIGPLALGVGIWWSIGTGTRWRAWAIAGAAALALVAPLVAWNMEHWASVLPLGQWQSNASNTQGSVFRLTPGQLLEGAGGLLVSPARGLLWFAPIAIAGTVRALRDRATRVLGLALVAQFLTIALFYMWWGGLCFGPRFLGEAVWLATWAALAAPIAARPWRIAVHACAALTVLVGLLGLVREPMQWELVHDVDSDHGELWQASDSVLPSLVTGRYSDVRVDERPHGSYRVCVGPRVELVPSE